MRIGKIHDVILDRAVLKKIQYRSDSLIKGPRKGADTSLWCGIQKESMAFTTNTVSGSGEILADRAFFRMLTDLACGGAKGIAMNISILLPKDSEESQLRAIMGRLGTLAKEWQVDLISGHTEVCDKVMETILSYTGIGVRELEFQKLPNGKQETQVILVGYPGACAVWNALQIPENRQFLREHLSEDFLVRAEQYGAQWNGYDALKIACEVGVISAHNATGNGVFGALWELAEGNQKGIQIDLKKIQIRQETIEICEQFDWNPYQIDSDGVFLIETICGEEIVEKLQENGYVARVIGEMNYSSQRCIINGDEKRFLVRPGTE